MLIKIFLSVRPFIALMELLTILSDVKLAHAILRKDMFEDIWRVYGLFIFSIGLFIILFRNYWFIFYRHSETTDEPKQYIEIEIEHLFKLSKVCNAWSYLVLGVEYLTCLWFIFFSVGHFIILFRNYWWA